MIRPRIAPKSLRSHNSQSLLSLGPIARPLPFTRARLEGHLAAGLTFRILERPRSRMKRLACRRPTV
jgi:hypothetical protein